MEVGGIISLFFFFEYIPERTQEHKVNGKGVRHKKGSQDGERMEWVMKL